MCGIIGGITSKAFNTSELDRSINALYHRGPDNYGKWVNNIGDSVIFLAHTRLSIIDLSESGNQPIVLKTPNFVIVFNGEIYNYRHIREILTGKGHEFTTSTDTEVVLRSWIEWREKCFEHFIGMFAFSIFDEENNKLIIARDRAGVKPLYYYLSDESFYFSSELKSFRQFDDFEKSVQLNIESVMSFLKRGWIGAPNSIYNNTYKLIPGHYLEVDVSTLELKDFIYWNPEKYVSLPETKISYIEALEETERLLYDAASLRMVSDVPVGVFLSGGYDSSTITALLQKESTTPLKTFSIGFEVERFNEAPYAREVAEILGTDHHEMICTEQQALEMVERIPLYYDEPFGDSSAIPTMLVSQLAAKHVKVALSADGGDEVFGGYGRYYEHFGDIQRLLRLKQLGLAGFSKLILPKFIGKDTPLEKIRIEKMLIGLSAKNRNDVFRARIEANQFSDEELIAIVGKYNKQQTYYDRTDGIKTQSSLKYMRCVEFQTTMVDDILTKVDRASMSYSIESREPMLDHRLWEWAARLPDDYLHGGRYPKRIIRDICHKYLPQQLMNRPKKGFAIPTQSWLSGPLKSLYNHYSSESFLKQQGLFSLSEINRFKMDYQSGRDKDHERVWIFLMFQMWWDKWMKH